MSTILPAGGSRARVWRGKFSTKLDRAGPAILRPLTLDQSPQVAVVVVEEAYGLLLAAADVNFGDGS